MGLPRAPRATRGQGQESRSLIAVPEVETAIRTEQEADAAIKEERRAES